jgi:hypothetical protein
MDVLSLIFPKEKHFYRMVEKQVKLVSAAVFDFNRLINEYEKLSPAAKKFLVNRISQKEKQDDDLYMEMVKALKGTFITPIDREDLHRLTSTLDIIIDSMETLSLKVQIFKIKKISKQIKLQSKHLFKALQLIETLIFSIENETEAERYCIRLRKLEQEGDHLYVDSLENIFKTNKINLAEVIKLKDLTSSIEEIIDKTHEASLIIENIVVKYS